jgi:hypothetical protein
MGDQQCTVAVTGRHILVTDPAGRRLDPAAATVLLALGGPEPAWLRGVEALSVVAWWQVGDRRALEVAVEALGWPRGELVKQAAVTTEPVILLVAAVHGVVEIGRNPRCTPAAWEILRHHRDAQVRRRALLANPVLPPTLAVVDDEDTLVRVGRSPECPPELLRQLARRSFAVQLAVAGNPSAPPGSLERFALSGHVATRAAAAGNPSCPRRCRWLLLVDRYAQVRVAAIGNRTLVPAWRAAARVYADPTPQVHVALARRPDLAPRTLCVLERYGRGDPLPLYREPRNDRRNSFCTSASCRLERFRQ